VLQTVLVEIEEVLNPKPLGYVSSNVTDVPDPVTNSLLMGHPDVSLLYPKYVLLSCRRWRRLATGRPLLETVLSTPPTNPAEPPEIEHRMGKPSDGFDGHDQLPLPVASWEDFPNHPRT